MKSLSFLLCWMNFTSDTSIALVTGFVFEGRMASAFKTQKPRVGSHEKLINEVLCKTHALCCIFNFIEMSKYKNIPRERLKSLQRLSQFITQYSTYLYFTLQEYPFFQIILDLVCSHCRDQCWNTVSKMQLCLLHVWKFCFLSHILAKRKLFFFHVVTVLVFCPFNLFWVIFNSGWWIGHICTLL